jgi:hypothetical protein
MSRAITPLPASTSTLWLDRKIQLLGGRQTGRLPRSCRAWVSPHAVRRSLGQNEIRDHVAVSRQLGNSRRSQP